MNVAVHVQHHPSRAHLIPELVDRLGGATVIEDPEPDARKRSALRTYLTCLEACPDTATHLVVVQDDAYPCDSFRARAENAIRERPEHLIALYLGGAPASIAMKCKIAHERGDRWVEPTLGKVRPADRYVNTVALVWPVQFIAGFPPFARSQRWATGGDDNAVGEYLTKHRIPVAVLVPSIVEHPDREPSLFDRRPGHGRNRFRVAAVFRDA